MSVFSGLSRPLKAAGVALIGVAIIAAVVGGISALSGNGSNEAGSSTTPGPSTSGGAPTSSKPSSPAPSTPPPSATSPSPSTPPPTSSAPGSSTAPGNQQASNKWVTVRVLNNSLIKGLADRAADDFRASGWNVSEVGNYSQGVIEKTTAYFRPGTDEEAAAKQLAQEFGLRALPRFDGIKDATPGVIVIVTKEYQPGHKGS